MAIFEPEEHKQGGQVEDQLMLLAGRNPTRRMGTSVETGDRPISRNTRWSHPGDIIVPAVKRAHQSQLERQGTSTPHQQNFDHVRHISGGRSTRETSPRIPAASRDPGGETID